MPKIAMHEREKILEKNQGKYLKNEKWWQKEDNNDISDFSSSSVSPKNKIK